MKDVNEALLTKKKYTSSRMSALLVAGLSILNVILLLANLNFYFPFSATVPMLLVDIEGLRAGSSLSIVFLIIAVLYVAVMFVFWWLSGKYYPFFIVLLVVFSLDTLALIILCVASFALTEFDPSLLIDVAFHAWVIYEFVIGIIMGRKLKKTFKKGVGITYEEIIKAYGEVNTFTQPEEITPPTVFDEYTGESKATDVPREIPNTPENAQKIDNSQENNDNN